MIIHAQFVWSRRTASEATIPQWLTPRVTHSEAPPKVHTFGILVLDGVCFVENNTEPVCIKNRRPFVILNLLRNFGIEGLLGVFRLFVEVGDLCAQLSVRRKPGITCQLA